MFVSLVDVPGHQRLVHTMIAGAIGIELVLLVVAADEGVMPQTREHVAACELLGLARRGRGHQARPRGPRGRRAGRRRGAPRAPLFVRSGDVHAGCRAGVPPAYWAAEDGATLWLAIFG